MSAVPLIVFGVLLVATFAIHLISYLLRPKSRQSRALLILGFVVIVCMLWQFLSVTKDAAEARLETAHIKEAMAWREFTKAQHDIMVSFLQGLPHSLKSTVFVDSSVGNADAKRYGSLIANALSDAIGAPIANPAGLSTCIECTGVWVCVNKNAAENTFEDGKVIGRAFEIAGIVGTKLCTDPNNGQGTSTTIKIIVGPKE